MVATCPAPGTSHHGVAPAGERRAERRRTRLARLPARGGGDGEGGGGEGEGGGGDDAPLTQSLLQHIVSHEPPPHSPLVHRCWTPLYVQHLVHEVVLVHWPFEYELEVEVPHEVCAAVQVRHDTVARTRMMRCQWADGMSVLCALTREGTRRAGMLVRQGTQAPTVKAADIQGRELGERDRRMTRIKLGRFETVVFDFDNSYKIAAQRRTPTPCPIFERTDPQDDHRRARRAAPRARAEA